jgi:hypothetical protein
MRGFFYVNTKEVKIMSNDRGFAHSKRANRAAGAMSAAEVMAEQEQNKAPERKVSSEFDPQVFDHRTGMTEDDQHDPALTAARRGYAVYGKNLSNWVEREKVIFSDPFEITDKKRMTVAKMVKNEVANKAELIDNGRRAALSAMSDIDREIDKAFKARLPKEEAAEIRGYVRDMSKADRQKFLAQADEETVSAILSSKSFLSGLSDNEAMALRHKAVTKLFPDHIQRRKKLERAVEQLDNVHDLYWRQIGEFVPTDELEQFEKQKAAVKAAVAGE